jgi:hypothetical protein
MKLIAILLFAFLPFLLIAGSLELEVEFCEHDAKGYHSAPGRLRSPSYTVNILLPKDAEILHHEAVVTHARPSAKSFADLNPPFISSDAIIASLPQRSASSSIAYLGEHRWGEMSYASFRVLPYDQSSGLWDERIRFRIMYDAPRGNLGKIPATFMAEDFFVNQEQMPSWYRQDRDHAMGIRVVGSPELYAALGPWVSFRQGQGFELMFSDINLVLAQSPGSNLPEKLRNHLIDQLQENPFSYLLLLGDHDLVPIAQLCPEPNGNSTVPSDFYYADLSSDWDTDNDGRLGEYYSQYGEEDYGVSYTPEAFVGRISTNSAAEVAAIALRIVEFEQSGDAFKQKALLPAAFLNYANEPVLNMPQTDGATFSEFARQSVLRDFETSTLYEELGVVQSYPADYALNQDNLSNLIQNQDYGIISWSAHGSPVSSSRKIWMQDYNSNGIPDANEMQWMGMVDTGTFYTNNSQYGTVIFAASCHNGYLDYHQPSLAEIALINRAVGVVAATRTGWYKVGWQNPGWGGLSSYNYHFLENYAEKSYSAGAALAYANLLHTRYYLFGDPIDDDGVIWPELQNVYAYILFGDPVLGHSTFSESEGEILVYSPQAESAYRLVNSIRENADYNVVFSNRLIPDYDYLDGFEAIFCVLDDYELAPWERDLLDAYLASGGKIYMEGNIAWDSSDSFWGKFGVEAPMDFPIIIEGLNDGEKSWAYQAQGNAYYELVPMISSARAFLFTDSCPSHTIGVFNDAGTHMSIASAFRLSEVLEAEPGTHRAKYKELIEALMIKLELIEAHVSVSDEVSPQLVSSLNAWPNPTRGEIHLKLNNPQRSEQEIAIYNVRGQKLRSLSLSAKNGFEMIWDGRDSSGQLSPGGVYILRTGKQTKKITLLR